MPLNLKYALGAKYLQNHKRLITLCILIKVFGKKGKELETLMQTIRIYSHDSGMEFGIEKYAMIIKKEEKEKQRKE